MSPQDRAGPSQAAHALQACLSDFEKFKQKMADRENAMQRAANQQVAEARSKHDALAQRLATATADVEHLRHQTEDAAAHAAANVAKVCRLLHAFFAQARKKI